MEIRDNAAELGKILENIREKTGTNVRLTPRGGDETQFTVDYCGCRQTAFLDGTGAETERLARLIAYTIAEADSYRLFSDKTESLKNVLLGEGGSGFLYRCMTKFRIPDAPCYAMEILPEKRLDETVAHIGSCISDTGDAVIPMDDTKCAVVRFSEGESGEFAQFLSQSLFEELGVRASIGIGGEVQSFTEIARSYAQAATAIRMSNLFHSRFEVHSYQEFLLVRMLEEVPVEKLKEYARQYRLHETAEMFEDEELSNTAEEFLESDLNLSETARKTFMHRNTLTYRLDKIERMTGLDIRKFSDAVTLRVMTILYKLLK